MILLTIPPDELLEGDRLLGRRVGTVDFADGLAIVKDLEGREITTVPDRHGLEVEREPPPPEPAAPVLWVPSWALGERMAAGMPVRSDLFDTPLYGEPRVDDHWRRTGWWWEERSATGGWYPRQDVVEPSADRMVRGLRPTFVRLD